MSFLNWGLRYPDFDKIRKQIEEAKQAEPEACNHSRHMPAFDEVAARALSAPEIRKRWPRYMGPCSDCGQRVILYASYMHYLAGDY